MQFLIEISYDPAAAEALRTLALEAGETFSEAVAGKRSDRSAVVGSWVALESGTAYLVLDAKDGVPVYELCHEVTSCAPGVKVRVVPVLPAKVLGKRLNETAPR